MWADIAGLHQEQGADDEAAAALAQAEALIMELASRITTPTLQTGFRAASLPVYPRCF